jgi:hypothetical protein
VLFVSIPSNQLLLFVLALQLMTASAQFAATHKNRFAIYAGLHERGSGDKTRKLQQCPTINAAYNTSTTPPVY